MKLSVSLQLSKEITQNVIIFKVARLAIQVNYLRFVESVVNGASKCYVLNKISTQCTFNNLTEVVNIWRYIVVQLHWYASRYQKVL